MIAALLLACWAPKPDVVVTRDQIQVLDERFHVTPVGSKQYHRDQAMLSVALYDAESPIRVAVQPGAALRSVARIADVSRGKPLLIDDLEIVLGGTGEFEHYPLKCWHLRVDIAKGVAVVQRSNGGPLKGGQDHRLLAPDGSCTLDLDEALAVLETLPKRCETVSLYGKTTWSEARPWFEAVAGARILLHAPDDLRVDFDHPSCEYAVPVTSLDFRGGLP